MTIKEVTSKDSSFRYQLLARMQADCKSFLGNGHRLTKNLWALNVEDQIKYMKALWHSFADDQKPEWITYEEILKYECQMKEKPAL